jgi:tryptophan halogenase
VRVGPDGRIAELKTAAGTTIAADLFVDCSGFRSLLFGAIFKEPWESYAELLKCDAAIAMRVPYLDPATEAPPFTRATALSTGWAWTIPLIHRFGTGYVYSTAYQSDDDAEAEFRRFLGEERVRNIPAARI